MTSDLPQVVRTVSELRATIAAYRRQGKTIGLVPTMGNLHEGHVSLTRIAHNHADIVCTTIFVNPTQFGPGEDLDAYPRTFEEDRAKLRDAGVELIFAPNVEEMYRPDASTTVSVGGLTTALCGSDRPTHFSGVATIVTKLLMQSLPDVAVFGEKDFQQLQVIRRLVRDLDIPVTILGGAICREENGLAMSSRNRYLTAEQRETAAILSKTLGDIAKHALTGAPLAPMLREGQEKLLEAGFDKVDYLEIRHEEDLSPCKELDKARPARLFAAAHLGRARLIDNCPVVNP
ncbi:pantoate--beta-alanine ligase [Aestuariispira insulae]|uniref:Pantothenate synthetase n=1 Tax=Aestuariispira insulae TaxID=1461337 RepID=A0A3D9HSE8_9PROT|nr:pantoate--beta-alanine ligase [Aestuariispira insulae]RED52345.1 pantothenate synthetase [Aestuariispira insulae]